MTVSVITCTYNRGHLIGEAIQSVLDQSYQDFEHIIVDESSKDNTEEVVKSFGDERIKYFKIPNTKGHLSKLINYGINHSMGQYLAIFDSDDVMAKNRLELQVKALEQHPQVGFSFSDVEIFNQQGTIKKSLFNKFGDPFVGNVYDDFINNKFAICQTTLFLRKECLKISGFVDENLHSGSHNFAVWLSYHHQACIFYEPLVRVRRHDQNTTQGTTTIRLDEHLFTLNDLFNQQKINKSTHNRMKSHLLYARGLRFRHLGKPALARKDLLESFRSKPTSWKALARYFQTWISS